MIFFCNLLSWILACFKKKTSQLDFTHASSPYHTLSVLVIKFKGNLYPENMSLIFSLKYACGSFEI